MISNLLPSFSISCSALLVATILCLTLWYYVNIKWRNLPPGPLGIPIFGYAFFLGKPIYVEFRDLSKKYGDVVSLDMFGQTVIVLNSYEAIRECFVKKGDEFAGRGNTEKSFFWWVVDGLGIAQDQGPAWREHRRFTLQTLRDFGLGKLSFEEKIQSIGTDLLFILDSTRGEPYDTFHLLANSTTNVILYLMADKHFKTDDPVFLKIRKSVRTVLKTLQGFSIFIQTPLMKILPLRWNPGYSELLMIKEGFKKTINGFVKEHQDVFDENHLRDYIDVFLKEMKDIQKEGRQQDSTFTIERLTGVFLNLLNAGTETTSNIVYWAIRLLMHRPEVQERIHRELDEVVGKERLPSIMDRPDLTYIEAVILEVLRISTIVPLGFPHSNPVASTLGPYNIPARSIVIANLWAVHNDPRVFPQPEKFDPERFMDPLFKDKRRERVVPFSIGKRSCLGESLARMEIFIFFTMIFQRFSFHCPEEDKGSMKLENTFLNALVPYKVIARPRT